MKKAFFSGLLLLAVSLLSGAEFAKVQNFTIVLPDKPTAIESAAAAEQKRDSRCKNRYERREGCEKAAFCDFSEVAEQPAHAADRDHHRDVAEAVRRAEDYITQRRAEERRNQTFLRNSRRE